MGQANTTTRIIGWDAATKEKLIGLAWASFDPLAHKVTIEEVLPGSQTALGATQQVINWVQEAKQEGVGVVIAVDAPLGWPTDMAQDLPRHSAGDPLPTNREQLFSRETDRVVRCVLREQSLAFNVGADKIAMTAHQTLRMIDDVRGAVGSMPLVRTARKRRGLLEVYPAATLIAGGQARLPQNANAQARQALIASLARRQPCGLRTAPTVTTTPTRDEFDAMVCALAAGDYLSDACLDPTAAQSRLARRESWIWFADPC